MTLPYERTAAVLKTEKFLLDLTDPKKTPGIPKAIRQEAIRCLRHYPSRYNMMYINESFEPLKELEYVKGL